MKHVERLMRLEACKDSVEYASRYHDSQIAWEDCDKPEWMIWLWRAAGPRDGESAKTSARMALVFARFAVSFVNSEEKSNEMNLVLEGAEAWIEGDSESFPLLKDKADRIRSSLSGGDPDVFAARSVEAAVCASIISHHESHPEHASYYAASYALDAYVWALDSAETHARSDGSPEAFAIASGVGIEMAKEVRKAIPVCPI